MNSLLASLSPETYRYYFTNEIVFWMGAALLAIQIYRVVQSIIDSRKLDGKLDQLIKSNEENKKEIARILDILADHKKQLNFSGEMIKDLVHRHERLVAQFDILKEDFIKHIQKE